MCDDADSLLLLLLSFLLMPTRCRRQMECVYSLSMARGGSSSHSFFYLCVLLFRCGCVCFSLSFSPLRPPPTIERDALVLASLLFLSAADMSRDLFSFTIARPPSMCVLLLFPSILEEAAAKSLDPPLPPYFTNQSFVHTLVPATCLFHFGRN